MENERLEHLELPRAKANLPRKKKVAASRLKEIKGNTGKSC
jgi:hypothetical protein